MRQRRAWCCPRSLATQDSLVRFQYTARSIANAPNLQSRQTRSPKLLELAGSGWHDNDLAESSIMNAPACLRRLRLGPTGNCHAAARRVGEESRISDAIRAIARKAAQRAQRKIRKIFRCPVVTGIGAPPRMTRCRFWHALPETEMTKKTSTPATPMTPTAASRIQSATASSNGGQVAARSFAARAQRAAAGGRKKA